MSVNDLKELSISYEGQKFKIEFKDNQPRKTRIFDEKGDECFRIARKILREEVKRLGLSEDGYLYTSTGSEYITNAYFRKVYSERNK